MKKIILVIALACLASCKKEKEVLVQDKVPELLTIEVAIDEGPHKDLVVNLKEKYFVYANSSRIAKSEEISNDTIFKLDSTDVQDILERYKKVYYGKLDIKDSGKMHTHIELVFTDKSHYIMQDGKVRTSGQREFLRMVFSVLILKTENQKVGTELNKMFGGMARF